MRTGTTRNQGSSARRARYARQGVERDRLLRRARQTEMAAQMSDWLRSRGANAKMMFQRERISPAARLGRGRSHIISTLEARASEFRRGWPAMIACLIGQAIGLHTLPPFTIGLFIVPLQQEFGWTRTSISFGITIITIGTALSAPLIGAIVDRTGVRILIASGMLALAAGYFALSLMQGSIVQFWAIMALMALLGTGCTPVTLSRIIVALFDRRRGAALGLTLVVLSAQVSNTAPQTSQDM